jgi:site-specific DNA recombinase
MTYHVRRTDPIASLIDRPRPPALAVSYLRVSTKEQAEKGGTRRGLLDPRPARGEPRKAEQLGAIIVEEFVDAGESARKADRPELMRMIQYVKPTRSRTASSTRSTGSPATAPTT